jgi:hypothetical protein
VMGLSLFQWSHTGYVYLIVCDQGTSKILWPGHDLGCSMTEKNYVDMKG